VTLGWLDLSSVDLGSVCDVAEGLTGGCLHVNSMQHMLQPVFSGIQVQRM
jgi:hypothetical protein